MTVEVSEEFVDGDADAVGEGVGDFVGVASSVTIDVVAGSESIALMAN